MYYRIASFQIDPQYESEFLDAANSFRKEIKTTKEPPFIDFVKTSDTKAMIVITYESENSVVKRMTIFEECGLNCSALNSLRGRSQYRKALSHGCFDPQT